MKRSKFPAKKYISISLLFVFPLIILTNIPVFAQAPQDDEAIVILSTVTIAEMQQARKVIESFGGRINTIFPPSVFIANVAADIAPLLKSQEIIKEISYKEVDPNFFKDYEASTIDAIKLWNKILQEKSLPKKKTLEQISPRTFYDELTVNSDIPKTREEKIKREKDYLAGWQIRKQEFLRKEEKKKQDWLLKQGKPQGFFSVKSATSEASAESSFGKANGAGFNDTSLYLAGDIAVGIFFIPGSAGNWTIADIDSAYDEVVTALRQFSFDEPNAKITFTPIKEVDENGVPNLFPPGNDFQTYVNDLRNTYNTHWAYAIIIEKGTGPGIRGVANLFGPLLKIWSLDSLGGNVVRHETMHIFGASDQYAEAGPEKASPTSRWGYLYVVHGNSEYNDGTGYFAGAGEAQIDLMKSDGSGLNVPIGIYSRGQVGWRDSDGDGILDPLDTFPYSIILDKTISNNQITYTGVAQDKPINNDYNNTYTGLLRFALNDVGLNTISSVDYRINQGAWVKADSQDGNFDTGNEDFTFTTPELKNGNYTIEVRATNSAGNSQIGYANDEVIISGSSVTNVAPFAYFTVNPPASSTGRTFTADASLSSDIDQSTSSLQVRWDYEDDGIWNTGFSTTKTTNITYPTSGTKTIRLEVKDSANLTHQATRQVLVSSSNIPPTAKFCATPENQQNGTTTFPVTFDATASWDGEDPVSSLQAKWDFDGDGTWDTPYSNNLIANYNYSLTTPSNHWLARLELKDTNNNTSQDRPHVWSVSYNHTPSLSNLTATYKGGKVKSSFKGAFGTLGSVDDIHISGNFAYLAEGTSGLEIFDISNPIKPRKVGYIDTPGEANGVFTVGNLAFIADGTSGLKVVDVSTPRTPTFVGLGVDTANIAMDVFVNGNYAYVSEWQSGLLIINISNPNSPVLVRTVPMPASRHAYDAYVSGDFAYVACWSNNTIEPGSLEIINVSNPPSAVLVGSYLSGDVTGVFVKGNYAYISVWDGGIDIIDVSNPSSPTSANFIQFNESIYGLYVSGDYLYFVSNSFVRGLHVVDISEPTSPVLVDFLSHELNASGIFVTGPYVYVASGPGGLSVICSGNVPTPMQAPDFEMMPILGYDVDVVGNYAYVSGGDMGFYAVEISDPIRPTIVDYIDIAGNAKVNSAFVRNNLAYVAYGTSGIKILDITYPNSLALFGPGYNTIGDAKDIFVKGDYAFVADGANGLVVIDIGNPLNPMYAAAMDTDGDANGIYVDGDYLYLADGDGGLKIFDIATKNLPRLEYTYTSAGGFVSGVSVQGDFAYVAANGGGVKILNIANPTSPVEVGDGFNLLADDASNIFIYGDYAYIAEGAYGLMIIDISNPASPFLVGSINFPNGSLIQELGYANNVFVRDDYCFVADMSFGVQMVYLGPHLNVSVDATDVDFNTTWDGVLEYRWDINNDQIWDRPFATLNSVEVPVVDTLSTLVCNVKDRFNATNSLSAAPLISYPPRISPLGDKSVVENNLISFQVEATDRNNDILAFSADGLPSGASFTDNGNNTATFSWTPNTAQIGSHSITFNVSDGGGLSDSRTINVTVLMGNRPPVLNPIGTKFVYAGSTLNFQISATDPNNDPLTYSASNLPAGATFNLNTRTFSWTTSSSDIGFYDVTFSVSDGQFIDSETIEIRVLVYQERRCYTCFLAGTPILMADGSTKPIEKLKAGDSVLAFDEKTGELKPDSVTEFFHHKADKYLIINKKLKITENHPVYSDGKWVEIGKLKVGDKLVNVKGESIAITSIKEVRRKVDTYNLEVNPYHTYIAGGIVVHNKAKYCWWWGVRHAGE
ncbi:MAG: polymorphic toxin-type HINT domain-containing protein [Candidatus Omnitrophota bacterium]